MTGERVGRLTWVSAEESAVRDLVAGRRVLVRDGDREWLGEVVVPSGQVAESPEMADLPVIVRLVTADDAWPTVPERAGKALLSSVGLPAALLEPTVS